jgi:hypothetical protein
MSYEVTMVDPKTEETAQLPVAHADGGTYVEGGSNDASLNVTYNYSELFRIFHPEGLWWLNGKTGDESILLLNKGIEALGIEQDPDYWKATPGNAGHVLNILLRWAKWFPNHVFHVI